MRHAEVRVMRRKEAGELEDIAPLHPRDAKLVQTVRSRPNRRALREAQKALEEPARWRKIPAGIVKAVREGWRVLREEVGR